MKVLPESFYKQDTLTAARQLLGKILVHHINGAVLAGMIVETEAYIGPFDKAAHSYNNRRTERNQVMYGPPGFAYVYHIYGIHYCMNVVTGDKNKPEAVLIRALQPVEGMNIMAKNRFAKEYDNLDKRSILGLTNGPGKLCKALGINKSNNGDDLCKSSLLICEGTNHEGFQIESSARINIGYAEEAIDYPWRFFIKHNPYVSPYKVRLNS